MAHSRIAASASSRWLKCTGSINLIEVLRANKKIPESTTNPASERGTAVHYIIEQVLLKKKKVKDFLGKRLKVDGMTKHALITSHDIEGAKICLKYIGKTMKKIKAKGKKAKMFPERKYDLSKVYKAPVGGTADITIAIINGLLEIVDYKNGRGHVPVKGTTQLRIYALGAYYALFKKYDFKKVKLTIVQPNDGTDPNPIRSETLKLSELFDFEREELLPALSSIMRAGGNKPDLVPNAKEQCYWCEAKTFCPAYKKNKPKFLKDVLGDIIPTTSIDTLPEPNDLSPEELSLVLQNADTVIQFYLDCKAYATQELEKDRNAISGWDVAPKLGNRKFADEKLVSKKMKKRKLKKKDFTVHIEDRMMTVTEMERHLKSELDWDTDEVKTFMEEITVREPNGFALKKVDEAEEEFAEFAQTETKTTRKKTAKKRRNK